ncbi:4Fe-4S dicluster domain-containing protein [Campylobacter gastrosuis]|uniref:4Fe-4S dicluster domain-containing protein n=1 Tax=Campylobacter gastrosuis TaxID=2974576 RepID=A0ABT7HRF8_9BACT|nr:4Fe-4S dicluster domain-containing protein [Campylobacter gastrosuis]MDL0089496.1 4Fe-4S dicluster domain-containing protein [Campylobacter gastrosuis]
MKTRRNFLKFIALCAVSLNANETKFKLRPPGALDEGAFLSSCIKCGQCLQVCPYDSIKLSDISDIFGIGAPYISPENRGCYLCQALPCVLACPSGALNHEVSEVKSVFMGRAVIDEISPCFAFKNQNVSSVNLKKAKNELTRNLNEKLSQSVGKICDLCVQFCPLEDKAIKIENNTPEILANCVGCGVCVELCPAKIIKVIPK